MNRPKSNNKELKTYNETGLLRVLRVLFQHPDKEFTLSSIASEAHVAKQNIRRIVNQLYSQNLVEKAQWGKRMWRIKARQKEWKFLKAKMMYNLAQLYESGLVEFLEEIFDRPRAIILFGSYRYGEDISSSDIDIAIETPFTKEYDILRIGGLREHSFMTKERYEKLKNIEGALRRELQLHLFNKVDFSRKEFRKNVFNSIVNGIVLYGYLEIPNESRKN